MSHAMAMVLWSRFRPGRSGGLAHDYGSKQRRLHSMVGDGGTLWLVTSRKKGRTPRTYHLAYKLSGCRPVPPEESAFSGMYPFVVRATESAVHFGYNEAGDVLERLEFTSGKPMAEVSNKGLRLTTIPGLTKDDISLLKTFQHRIETGRSAFLSYASEDAVMAAALESALAARNISVARDMTFLRAGENFAEAIEREVASTDSFLVLVTEAAAASRWVHQETAWATEQLAANRIVKRIVPLLVDEHAWRSFPALEDLHRFPLDRAPSPAQLDRLAEELRTRI